MQNVFVKFGILKTKCSQIMRVMTVPWLGEHSGVSACMKYIHISIRHCLVNCICVHLHIYILTCIYRTCKK